MMAHRRAGGQGPFAAAALRRAKDASTAAFILARRSAAMLAHRRAGGQGPFAAAALRRAKDASTAAFILARRSAAMLARRRAGGRALIATAALRRAKDASTAAFILARRSAAMLARRRAGGRAPVAAAAALARATAAALALALALAGCGTAAPARPATASPPAAAAPATAATSSPGAAATASAAPTPPAVPAFRHVFLVVMENLGYSAAMATPALASLAHRYAYATSYDAVAHPSLPNYLALASGGTWGVTSDCTACYRSEPNLASQLAGAGISWGAYMEGLPSSCDLTAYDLLTDYAGKHDPFRYFTDVRGSKALCGHIQPLTALNLRQPPRFAWITPNLCHDGHDCPAAQAGAWLVGFVAQVTASAAWRNGGVLFVTWDEGNGGDPRGGGGHVLTLVIAPGLPAGEQVAAPLNHYSLLHTIEAGLGLPPLGLAARAPLMSAFWAPAAH